MISAQKVIAWSLISLLLFQEIFQVPFLLPDVAAFETKKHEDIVSLIVEQELYKKMPGEIDSYARRIQQELPNTRATILTFPRDTHPYLIAAANERLYFSGLPDHGSATQKLVGTILIGHNPLPVVHTDTSDFLSMYPYTDFDNPVFFWNWDALQYQTTGVEIASAKPEVWHSVIDPNTGDLDTDVARIKEFFTRVYDYDGKKGKYANVGEDPQVLYMDSVNESKSTSLGMLAVYEKLFLPLQEHIGYHRYTRDLAEYIYSNFLSTMESDGSAAVKDFKDWRPAETDETFLKNASDITTKVFSDELLMPFLKVINEKYLGDVSRWVHNSGRYYRGYSDVSVDTLPEIISKKDALTSQILKGANDTLEKLIDKYVDANMSMDIPILVERPLKGGFTYDNYFFGTQAKNITSASQCSLVSGSTFAGRNTTVELNHAYNVLGAADDGAMLAKDAKEKIACQDQVKNYWGGNTPLNLKYTDGAMKLGTRTLGDFSQPIRDLGGAQTVPTTQNSPLDCLKNDLLLRPFQTDNNSWPKETKGLRYSCDTDFNENTGRPFFLDPSPEVSENILTSFTACTPLSSKITLITRAGGSTSQCVTTGITGTYKSISSLIKHNDPSRDVYAGQLTSITTPNLPVDEERYLTYLNRAGTVSKISYPNLFDIQIDPQSSDEDIWSTISAYLNQSQTFLVPGQMIAGQPWSALIPTSITVPRLFDVIAGNPELKASLIEALRWKYLDIEEKYSHGLTLAVSSDSESDLLMPDKKKNYEIAYLGGKGDATSMTFGYTPDDNQDFPEWYNAILDAHDFYSPKIGNRSGSASDFSLSPEEQQAILGRGDEGKDKDACNNPPDGVVIWKWPAAIACWLKNLFKTSWKMPDLGDFEFPTPSVTLRIGNYTWTTQPIKRIEFKDEDYNSVSDYVQENAAQLTLTNILSSSYIEPGASIKIDTILGDGTSRIDDDISQIELVITRVDDLASKASYTSGSSGFETALDNYVSLSGSTQLRDGHASWILVSKSEHPIRVFFETRIYSSDKNILQSASEKLIVTPLDINVSVLGSANSTIGAVVAGDTNGIAAVLKNGAPLPSAVDVEIVDYISGTSFGSFKKIPVINNTIRLGSPLVDDLIKRAGRYTMTVIAGDSYGKTEFTIEPGPLDHIDINTSSLYLSDTPETLTFALKDKLGNSLDQSSWQIKMTASNPIDVPAISPTTGREFTLTSSEILFTPRQQGSLDLTFVATRDGTSLTKKITRPILSDIRIVSDVQIGKNLQVGKTLPITFRVERNDGTLVDAWDKSLSITVIGGDASLDADVKFDRGIGIAKLNTGTQATSAQFAISGTFQAKLVGDSFTILPGEPREITLQVPNTLSSQANIHDTVHVRVFDEYRNPVNVPADHKLMLSVDRPGLFVPIGEPVLKDTGHYEFALTTLGNPGRALLRTWIEKDGKKSSIKTLENVATTTLAPVLTSSEVAGQNWNTLTQVLLGGPFGKTPIQGYLGGAMLYKPDAYTLSLSTLVDMPTETVLSVLPTGNITTKTTSGIDMIPMVTSEGRLTMKAYGSAGTMALVTYPEFSADAFGRDCGAGSDKCDQDMILFSPGSSDVSFQNKNISYRGVMITRLENIFKTPGLAFSYVANDGPDLILSVQKSGTLLGYLSLRIKSQTPSTADANGSFHVELVDSVYRTELAWNQLSSYESPGINIVSSENEDLFGTKGWSSYPDNMGLGWTDDNTDLLSFASGGNWSKSLLPNTDIVTIHLGDPVISLPQYGVHSVTGLDHSIGIPVFTSESGIHDFTFRDTNADGRDDLVVYEKDGNIGLEISRGDGTTVNLGDYLSLSQAESSTIRVGDFTNDGRSDAVYVDAQGNLRLVQFDASGPREITPQYATSPLFAPIAQLEVFDMDHDEFDDVIVLDTLGSLTVLYGSSSGVFTVHNLGQVYDFVFSAEPKTTFFTGAVRYSGPGFVEPQSFKASSPDKQSELEQTIGILYRSVVMGRGSAIEPTANTDLGDLFGDAFTSDPAFTSMYDGDSAGLDAELRTGFNEIGESGSIQYFGADEKTITQSFLNAAFVDPKSLLITKKYESLEASKKLNFGSPIRVTMTLKNTSSRSLSQIKVLENFATYLNVIDYKYEYTEGGKIVQKDFTAGPDEASGIIDLGALSLAPGASLNITYEGSLRSFDFGRFDVGLLEDATDPNLGALLKPDQYSTINSEALKKDTLPERDFFNTDNFGDIRFNPNASCGGPIIFFRSHNTFDRTYEKTLIVRDIANPEANAVETGVDPATAFSSINDNVEKAQSDLEKWQTDTDGDNIPDRGDDDHGDFITIDESDGNIRLDIGGDKVDKIVDDITQKADTILKGLSCGFGDAGCISSPINWAFNIPGNTMTAMGFAIPGVNRAPVACYKDVRCGVPIFSFPTICPSGNIGCTWPVSPLGAGGALDISAPASVAGALTYKGGLGISNFRLFLGGTLTGSIATAMCFGPNNAITNFPGMFPVRFDGNCIFAAVPLMQCSDDGSNDSPLVLDLDIAGNLDQNDFTDADSCEFYTPIANYSTRLQDAVRAYFANKNDATLEALQTVLAEESDLIIHSTGSDDALRITSSVNESTVEGLNALEKLAFKSTGNGNGMIQISLNPSELKFKDFGKVIDVQLKSIGGFPNFIMDWFHRQKDEILASLGHLPDIKIYLPDFSALADGGWKGAFANSKPTQNVSTNNKATTPQTASTASLPPARITQTSTSNGIGSTLQNGINTTLGTLERGKNSVTSFVKQKTSGIQQAFEYVGSLPIVDVHPESINLEIPWVSPRDAQSWLVRNEAILDAWKKLPKTALGAIDTSPTIASIQSNIETVRSYLELPQRIQSLFYFKEKLLYGILQNVAAVQQLMGGWLSDNGQRFKTWVETFILVTKLWDTWQILIDVFNDHEAQCGTCRNERWNLQQWLWSVISAVIPPIPVIQMPRWPDIEMDFSDIDLSLDVTYPVFNFSFYPISLPDIPAPGVNGVSLPSIPQLPKLPDFSLDFDIPVIQLPKLPDLPPPPKLPKLTSVISAVLKIFKLVTLIQCLYRKIPLSPEWYVGTKIAHKTERQGYLSFDFLKPNLPTISTKWIDAIRVSSHVKLKYDVSFITDSIKDVLKPLSDFPRNIGSGKTPSTININLDPNNGPAIQTSDAAQISELIGSLFNSLNTLTYVSAEEGLRDLQSSIGELGLSPASNQALDSLYHNISVDTSSPELANKNLDTRFAAIHTALQNDLADTKNIIADLDAWSNQTKNPEDIPLLAGLIPGTQEGNNTSQKETLLTLSEPVPMISPEVPFYDESPVVLATTDSNSSVSVNPNSQPENAYSDRLPDTQNLRRTRGLYVSNGDTTQRLIDYTENLDGHSHIHSIDDDRDGDFDVYYSLDNTIYRKENYKSSAGKYYIHDKPQVFNRDEVLREFFDLSRNDLRSVPAESQVNLLRVHSYGNLAHKFLTRTDSDHLRYLLFSKPFESSPNNAAYQIDLVPRSPVVDQSDLIISSPIITDIDGTAMIEHKQIYRRLLDNGTFTDNEGKTLPLSADFVIRRGQSGYASETTVIDVTHGGITEEKRLKAGERLVFSFDSNISVKRGTLILFGSTRERRPLSIRDINLPLLPGDRIMTEGNGAVTVSFADDTQTRIAASQTWVLSEYNPSVGIHEGSLPIQTGWYYTVATDPRTKEDVRTPHNTVFDLEGAESSLDPVSHVPDEIELKAGEPTEIDFQTYFPFDTLTNVDVIGLPSSAWRRVSPTRIIFESQKDSRELQLRITFGSVIRDFTTQLAAKPPGLMIDTFLNGKIDGTITDTTKLPLGIQSYIFGKSWTLSSGFLASENTVFTTQISSLPPTMEVSVGDNRIASTTRNNGTSVLNSTSAKASIISGKPLGYSVTDSSGKGFSLQFSAQNLSFSQLIDFTSVTLPGIYIAGSSLRLETATTADTQLLGGAYITDANMRPIIALDSSGIVRYLDTTVTWTVTSTEQGIVYTASRNRTELGKILLKGNMITAGVN